MITLLLMIVLTLSCAVIIAMIAPRIALEVSDPVDDNILPFRKKGVPAGNVLDEQAAMTVVNNVRVLSDRASVSLVAPPSHSREGDYLEPRLWEALRIELQNRYRSATGEPMAIIKAELYRTPSSMGVQHKIELI